MPREPEPVPLAAITVRAATAVQRVPAERRRQAERLAPLAEACGGVAAGLLWEATRHALTWFFATLSKVGVLYGSFATAISLLLSFEIAATVLLIGAQVIAVYEQQHQHPA